MWPAFVSQLGLDDPPDDEWIFDFLVVARCHETAPASLRLLLEESLAIWRKNDAAFVGRLAKHGLAERPPRRRWHEDCAVCLAPFRDDGDETLSCRHAFHRACLQTWLSRSPTCPLCRRPCRR